MTTFFIIVGALTTAYALMWLILRYDAWLNGRKW